MDEKAVVRAIAKAIDDNSGTFLTGVLQNGEQRLMEAAHKTVLGSITSYFTVKVHVRRIRGGFLDGVSNVSHGDVPRVTQYNVEVYFADYAVMEIEEEDSFLHAHENFRMVSNRIADHFLKGAEIFTDIESGKAFRLPTENRIVDLENLNPEESDDGFPILGSVIRFVVIGCND